MGVGSFLIASSLVFVGIGIWFNSNDFRPQEYFLPPPPQFVGPLAVKPLKGAEKLLAGKIHGAESIVVEKNTLYTCTVKGNCVKIVDGKIVKEFPLTTNKNCDGMRKTRSYCGRPLGIRRFNAKQFMVADAFLGLLLVDFEKAASEVLLSAQVSVAGKRIGFADDLDFVDNDTVIFSDASTKYDYNDFFMDACEHGGNGRMLMYKISTGEVQVLMDGLQFSNGVQIHPDKVSVLFTESLMARVHRYYFAGPKKGRHELFAANLPGFPDNIRLSANGKSFYVALFSSRNSTGGGENFLDWTAQWPMLRKTLGEAIQLLTEPLQLRVSEATYFATKYGIFVELDLDGNFVNSYHDPSGSLIHHISQITDDGGKYLYLASYSNDYIGRVEKHLKK